jgi:epoxide hydrolase-like predicted phosphatase
MRQTHRSIRAVVFDFGGVLTEPPTPVVTSIAEASGASVGELAALLLGAYGEDGDHPWHRLERGEIPFAELCHWASQEGTRRGWRLDLGPLPELMRDLVVREEMIDRVRSLRAEGYVTAIVTNNVREFALAWRAKLPLHELFDVVVDSCEVGLRKPDPQIYRLALERLGGLSPDQAVFLDDFDENVRGAERVGMTGILVGTDWKAALARLEEVLGANRRPA